MKKILDLTRKIKKLKNRYVAVVSFVGGALEPVANPEHELPEFYIGRSTAHNSMFL